MLDDNTYDDGTDLDDAGPLYPDIKVQLTGESGNALDILARCLKACRNADITAKEIMEFRRQAMDGDYEHLLQVCMRWFECS